MFHNLVYSKNITVNVRQENRTRGQAVPNKKTERTLEKGRLLEGETGKEIESIQDAVELL
jgi:hypothetical protein